MMQIAIGQTHRPRTSHRAFSLIELVIVMAIIGVLAAIAIPRMSQGASHAAETNLKANLTQLRSAIEMYWAEHNGVYPCNTSPGDGLTATAPPTFERQLTWYTSIDGAASETPDAVHCLGPYLDKIPELPLGEAKGADSVVCVSSFGTPGIVPDDYGWIYIPATGDIKPNCGSSEVDDDGNLYYDW